MALEVLQNKIRNFEFVPGSTPLSSPTLVLNAIGFYLFTIWSLQKFMQDRPPIKLRVPISIHNLALSIFSLVLLVLIIVELVPKLSEGGFYGMTCDPLSKNHSSGTMIFWFYLFYLSKIYEFIDTFAQVLRKKSLQFLHVWHHCTTLVLCWVTLVDKMPVQWVDITANLFVHIIMYYYYFLSDQGIQVWWKKYITRIQIIQFVWDISVHATWYFYKQNNPDCGGTIRVFHFSNLVIGSFLLLFIQFYIRAYKSRPARGARPESSESSKAKKKD